MELAICVADPSVSDGSEAEIRGLPFGEAETERLLAIKNPSARRQSVCARLALHPLLLEKGIPPLPITRTANGKPCFAGNGNLHFSLSHSPLLVAAALSDEPVGIDVETERRGRDETAIVRRFFTEEEQRLWAQAPTSERFYALWTKKEAAAKLDGGGLLGARNSDCVIRTFRLMHGDTPVFLSIAANRPIETIRWIFYKKELIIDELPN